MTYPEQIEGLYCFPVEVEDLALPEPPEADAEEGE